MSKEEVIKNLGTIARSGTKEFVQNLKSQEGDQTAELTDNSELVSIPPSWLQMK